MPEEVVNTLPKEERLCGKLRVSALLSKGKWGSTPHLRYCWSLFGSEVERNRILVSVPKKFFKRAVKRNLLKRRLREAYRTQKSLLAPCGICLMFVYSSKEIADYQTLREEMAAVLRKIAKLAARKSEGTLQEPIKGGSGDE